MSGFPEPAEYLASRGVMPSAQFYALDGELRPYLWTVSKLTQIADIALIQQSLIQALNQGQTFKQWQKSLNDTAGANIKALSKAHKETIYRNAQMSAYQAGRWARFVENKNNRPYLRYVAIGDHRTRPAHKAMHGMILPVDDARWAQLSPPNGHRCRCTLMSLSEKQAQALGYKPDNPLPTYTDKSGQTHTVHADHGWNTRESESAYPDLSKLLLEKQQKLGLPMVQMPEVQEGDASALANLPAHLAAKIQQSGAKIADFSGIRPQKAEVERLQNEGLRYSEAVLADKWQQYYQVSVVGFDKSKHKLLTKHPPDLVEMNSKLPEKEWKTLDIIFTMEPKANHKEFLRQFNKSEVAWNNVKENIIKHINKADVVPMYMQHFDEATASKIIDFLLSLNQEQRKKIVLIWESD